MQAVRLCTRLSTCVKSMNSRSRVSAIFACSRWVQELNTVTLRQYCSADIIPPAGVEGEDKCYAPKIQSLVDDISKLTLMEVADLNELLKKTLNITDAPMMAAAMPAMAGPAKEDDGEEEAKTQQSAFTVRLMGFDDKKKVALIKALKSLIEGMNLVQAKKFVESTPATVKADLIKEDAEKLKQTLEDAGGKVEIE